jgi:hypothetical protein
MEIIQNKLEYNRAKIRYEKIENARPGTKEYYEVLELEVLIERYERETLREDVSVRFSYLSNNER